MPPETVNNFSSETLKSLKAEAVEIPKPSFAQGPKPTGSALKTYTKPEAQTPAEQARLRAVFHLAAMLGIRIELQSSGLALLFCNSTMALMGSGGRATAYWAF